MKNIKRILLAFVAVFVAFLLVACGAKSDNGTYVYKPSKTATTAKRIRLKFFITSPF